MACCAEMFYVWQGGATFFSPVTNAQSGVYKFEPTPLFTLTNEWERDENGGRIIERRNYSLNGTILANRGINVPSGTLTGLAKIDKQQDLLRNAMGRDRQEFIVYDQDGYVVVDEFVDVVSLTFEEGVWVNICQYNLELSAEHGVGASGDIRSGSETWGTTQNEDGTVSITHSVEAQGIATSTSDAFTNAKNFVLTKVGQNPLLQSYFISLAGKSAFNHSKEEQVSRDQGSYSITETWLANNEGFLDDRQISVTEERNFLGTLAVASSGITGTVTGLSSTDDPSPSGRFQAALDGFNNIVKAQIGWDNTALRIGSREQTNNLLAGTVSYNLTLSPSGGDNEFINKSRTVTIDRNEDGSTTESVTAAAQVRLESPLTISDAIAFVDANVFPEDSVNPPFSAAGSFITGRGREKDEFQKSASMTVTYLDSGSVNYLEEYSVEISRDQAVNTGRITGTVRGLGEEPTVTSTTRFTNALAAYNSPIKGLRFSRVQAAAAGVTLSTNLRSEVYGENRQQGIINYSATFDDGEVLPSGVISENISINYSGGDPIFASIPIPGRPDGPIAQDMSTVDAVVITGTVNRVFEKTISAATQRASVCAKMVDMFGGSLPIGSPPKETLAQDLTAHSTTLTIAFTLTGSNISLGWRCS
jgi:hypothetical protein